MKFKHVQLLNIIIKQLDIFEFMWVLYYYFFNLQFYVVILPVVKVSIEFSCFSVKETT